MSRLSKIGNLLKKIYRIYSNDLIAALQERGFTDLRPSFLEILLFLCERPASSIKEIGLVCGLKKQTMTSHLNELEKRGYVTRATSQEDKREQKVVLTEYGEKFKLNLNEVLENLEGQYTDRLGTIEVERLANQLDLFLDKGLS